LPYSPPGRPDPDVDSHRSPSAAPLLRLLLRRDGRLGGLLLALPAQPGAERAADLLHAGGGAALEPVRGAAGLGLDRRPHPPAGPGAAPGEPVRVPADGADDLRAHLARDAPS